MQLVRPFGGSCWHAPCHVDGNRMLCLRDFTYAQCERVDFDHVRAVRLCQQCRHRAWIDFLGAILPSPSSR